MNKSLEHLPQYKKNEIEHVSNLIRKSGRIEMIVLFGSYARGDYVEKDIRLADGLNYPEEFRSDIDIMVVLGSKEQEHNFFATYNHLQKQIRKKIKSGDIKSPVSIIFNNILEINKLLVESNPFMKDVTE